MGKHAPEVSIGATISTGGKAERDYVSRETEKREKKISPPTRKEMAERCRFANLRRGSGNERGKREAVLSDMV